MAALAAAALVGGGALRGLAEKSESFVMRRRGNRAVWPGERGDEELHEKEAGAPASAIHTNSCRGSRPPLPLELGPYGGSNPPTCQSPARMRGRSAKDSRSPSKHLSVLFFIHSVKNRSAESASSTPRIPVSRIRNCHSRRANHLSQPLSVSCSPVRPLWA